MNSMCDEGLKCVTIFNMDMPATDTRIPVSEDVRKELRVLKAREDRRSYDETLAALLDAYDRGGGEFK